MNSRRAEVVELAAISETRKMFLTRPSLPFAVLCFFSLFHHVKTCKPRVKPPCDGDQVQYQGNILTETSRHCIAEWPPRILSLGSSNSQRCIDFLRCSDGSIRSTSNHDLCLALIGGYVVDYEVNLQPCSSEKGAGNLNQTWVTEKVKEFEDPLGIKQDLLLVKSSNPEGGYVGRYKFPGQTDFWIRGDSENSPSSVKPALKLYFQTRGIGRRGQFQLKDGLRCLSYSLNHLHASVLSITPCKGDDYRQIFTVFENGEVAAPLRIAGGEVRLQSCFGTLASVNFDPCEFAKGPVWFFYPGDVEEGVYTVANQDFECVSFVEDILVLDNCQKGNPDLFRWVVSGSVRSWPNAVPVLLTSIIAWLMMKE